VLRKLGHVLALFGLLVAELLALASLVLTLLATFGLGMVFLFPPQVWMIRWLTATTRTLVRRSTGVEIEPPYRWKWMIANPATWRDVLCAMAAVGHIAPSYTPAG